MEAITLLSLKPINDLESQLLLRGKEFLPKVPGVKLEDQYLLPYQRYLIITSYDCPYEELLRIILIQQDGTRLDSATIGAPYSPGVYAEPQITESQSLRFRFDTDAKYQVLVHGKPSIMLGSLFSSNGISYDAFLQRRYMSINRME